MLVFTTIFLPKFTITVVALAVLCACVRGNTDTSPTTKNLMGDEIMLMLDKNSNNRSGINSSNITSNSQIIIIHNNITYNNNSNNNSNNNNNNNNNRDNNLSPKERAVCITLFSIVLIVGIIGNSLVVHIYRSNTSRRFLKFEKLMLILGIVDLTASITNPLLFIYQMTSDYKNWHFGNAGCKIISAIGPIATSISLGIILIMCIDRDRAVASPFKSQFTIHIIYKASGATVLFAVLVTSPYMYFVKLQTGGMCTIDRKFLKQYSIYTLSLFSTSDVIFLLVLAFTTARVFYKVTRTDVANCSYPREQRIRETHKTLRTVTAMGIAFVVFIFPRDILQIVYLYFYLSQQKLSLLSSKNVLFLNAILKVLHTANSSVNVFLYSALNKRFRQEVVRIVTKSKFIRKISGYHTDSFNMAESRSTRKRLPTLASPVTCVAVVEERGNRIH